MKKVIYVIFLMVAFMLSSVVSRVFLNKWMEPKSVTEPTEVSEWVELYKTETKEKGRHKAMQDAILSANTQLPAWVDDITEVESASYVDGMISYRVVVHGEASDVVNLLESNQDGINEVLKRNTMMLCTTPRTRGLLEVGIGLKDNYYATNGMYLMSHKTTLKDCTN